MNHWDYQTMQGYGMPQQQWPMGWPQQQVALPQQQMPAVPQQMFPGAPEPIPPGMGGQLPGLPAAPGMLPVEMSYIENILRLNRGKLGTFYFTYENNQEWNAVVYRGVVEEAGRDHIILSDPETGRWYLLLMVNFDYATFDEELEYDYPYNGVAPTGDMSAYPPR